MTKNAQFGGIMMEYALVMGFLTMVVAVAFFGGSVDNYLDNPGAQSDSFEDPSIVHALNERQQEFADSIYQP